MLTVLTSHVLDLYRLEYDFTLYPSNKAGIGRVGRCQEKDGLFTTTHHQVQEHIKCLS